MKKLLILISVMLTLISCRGEIQHGKVIFISVASDYSCTEGLQSLDTPPADQKALSEEIEILATESGEYYEEYLFLEADGKRTVNGIEKEWTSDDILNTIIGLETLSYDLIIFHYSGHGEEGSGAFAPGPSQNARLYPEELIETLKLIDGKKCLFIDSCYSGNLIEDKGALTSGERFDDNELVSDSILNSIIPAIEKSFSSNAENTEIWTFTAATSEQLSYDSYTDENYGAFTYYLLRALGYDTDNQEATIPGNGGDITFYDIVNEVKKSMPADLRRAASPQATLLPLDLVLFSF